MKKYTRFLSCFVIASMLLINGCTSKTAVDNTPTDSDVIETTIGEANSVSQTTESVYVPETTPVETTEFDLNDYSFENVYGSQVINYLNHQYYFNGEPVPIVESNYYFVNTFLELSNYGNYYGAYPVTSEGFLDLAAAVPTNSDGTPPRFETFGDFYRQYSETMLYSTLIVLENAKEMNLTLDEDTINSIDELIVNLDENAAKPNNMTLDDYLALYYGPDCNEESFKQVLYNYYLNDVFTEYYISNYQYAEEDMIMSPTVRYALYYAPFGSEESVLSEAQDNAEGMFASCNNNIDTFAELGSAQYASGGNTEYGELTVTRGQTVPAFDAWCFDEARQPGDMDVIYAEEYGYFVVAFVKFEPNTEAMEEIAIENLGKQINANIEIDAYDFHTNDEFLPPVEVAGNEWITGYNPFTEPTVEVNDPDVEASQAIELEEAEPTYQTTTEVPEKNNNMMTVLIILASIGVVALLAILSLLIVKVRDGKNNSKSTSNKAGSSSSDDENMEE